jgi:diacylglycerol kinase family enzyme
MDDPASPFQRTATRCCVAATAAGWQSSHRHSLLLVPESRNGWRPAERPERPVLLINPASGDGRADRAALVDHARKRSIAVKVLQPRQPLAALVEEAVADGADALGIAGGDGSLGLVATAAHEQDIPFICIPAGTRNHFALDLGIDRRDLIGSLDAFTEGIERQIDVGQVNERLFLNNVSLGVYAEAVHEPGYRDSKARTLLATAHKVLGPSGVAPELHIRDDLGHEHRDPAVVLVSNNPYALDRPVAQGTRPSLDGGTLGVIVLNRAGIGDAPGRAWTATSLDVDAVEAVRAGIDGEAVELIAPLKCVSLPGALRVRISARHPGVSPSAVLP